MQELSAHDSWQGLHSPFEATVKNRSIAPEVSHAVHSVGDKATSHEVHPMKQIGTQVDLAAPALDLYYPAGQVKQSLLAVPSQVEHSAWQVKAGQAPAPPVIADPSYPGLHVKQPFA